MNHSGSHGGQQHHIIPCSPRCICSEICPGQLDLVHAIISPHWPSGPPGAGSSHYPKPTVPRIHKHPTSHCIKYLMEYTVIREGAQENARRNHADDPRSRLPCPPKQPVPDGKGSLHPPTLSRVARRKNKNITSIHPRSCETENTKSVASAQNLLAVPCRPIRLTFFCYHSWPSLSILR